MSGAAWYMTLGSVLLKLINAASDGRITLEEVGDIATEYLPEYVNDVVDSVSDAMDDGKITLDEVLDIIQTIVRAK